MGREGHRIVEGEVGRIVVGVGLRTVAEEAERKRPAAPQVEVERKRLAVARRWVVRRLLAVELEHR